MKNGWILLVAVIILGIASSSCKTTKKTAYTPEPIQPVVESNELKKPEHVEPIKEEVQVTVKTEDVSLAVGEDLSKDGFAFYVIVGSFSKSENALSFKNQLIGKGFNPVLLNSETGFVRVAVDQTNSERDAREMISKIRNVYPEYKDVWLLKKK
jgi:cell division protein FtsN